MVWADLGRFAVLVGLALILTATAQVNLLWLVVAAFLLGVGHPRCEVKNVKVPVTYGYEQFHSISEKSEGLAYPA